MTSNKLIAYQRALDILNKVAEENHLDSLETIDTKDAIGQVLADDILSPINVPSFNNSAMDGFAIRSSVVNQAIKTKGTIKLKVSGSIQAGDASDIEVDKNKHQAWEIMTGAPVPDIFDAVIQIENIEFVSNNNEVFIIISEHMQKGRNIRKLGTDYQVGQLVTKKHAIIQAQHIMALATVGINQIRIISPVPVAILSTGNELAKKSVDSLNSGKIFNSNQPYLSAYCRSLNCLPVFVGRCKDNPEEFNKLIDEAQKNKVKIIFSTGAVSMGKYDFIPQALLARGAIIHFHKVKIRPGKPILFAELPDGTFYFGLPGNPIAAAAGMRFFVSPFIRTLLKLDTEKTLKAKLLTTVNKKQGFRTFAKAITNVNEQGQLCVNMLMDQGSYQSRSFALSNCWLILSEDQTRINEGEIIEIVPMIPKQMIL